MLQFFRNIFKTKIGLALTIAFVALIGIAFAVGDVASNSSLGGVSGGDNVAVVGDDKIAAAEFSQAASTSLEQLRQQNPTLSMAAFVEQGGLEQVLDQLLDRSALRWWGNEHGLRAGDNLVNSEIRRIPGFAGPDGQFSDAVYRQALAQRKLSDAQVRRDLGSGLLAQQVLVPPAFGAKMPQKMAMRYAALTKERRQGTVALLPSAAFAPTGAPTQAQLAAFYAANKSEFIRPERRVLRYAEFGVESLGSQTPTAAEITARYNRDKAAKYVGKELRTFTQLIVPTQQAAVAIAKRGAGALESAAREAGLETVEVPATDKAALTNTASKAVADAAFSAARGTIAVPARGGLGWYVIRVDSVDQTASRSLDQARGEIVAALTAEKTTRALGDLAADVEGKLDEGSSLSDIARSLKVEPKTTPALVADGRVYGVTGQTAPPILAPVLQAAFEMEEGQPQLAAVPGTQRFLVFETTRITPSAAAPLKEIAADATAAWRLDVGAKAARAAADRVLAKVKRGTSLASAIAEEKRSLPTPNMINMTREELVTQGQRVPPPLALLFSMAKGSVKKLEGPNNAGWFVVSVVSVEPGKIAPGDPLLAQAGGALGQLLGREYSDALRVAIRKEAGIERNDEAIAAVRKQLTGGDGN